MIAPQQSRALRPSVNLSSFELRAKRILDVIGASLGLLVLSPVMLLVSACVRLESPGPFLYRPEVVGYGGRRFKLLKFRSMVQNAGEVLRAKPELWVEYRTNLKLKNDPRITRVGAVLRKFSLDELPQFINVLRGEMSLVGPRVLSELELERYGDARELILSVTPGLTGLWQVSGRHTLPFERRMELDLQYIQQRTLWLDIWIIAKTFPAVLSGRGAG